MYVFPGVLQPILRKMTNKKVENYFDDFTENNP
jgi:hypothetical protein